jgi:tryptophanyl-tRNA synthetase
MDTQPAPVKRANPRVFSGIQPTGELHIGNYLGASRTWIKMLAEHTGSPEDLIFCIVDAHAIKCTVFVQSDVTEHMELAWYLAAATPMGDLARMTQFKDKSDGKDFVSTALYTYPVLMSADILLYRATVVPVGDDQVQHLELARETARRFNHRFGKVFPENEQVERQYHCAFRAVEIVFQETERRIHRSAATAACGPWPPRSLQYFYHA